MVAVAAQSRSLDAEGASPWEPLTGPLYISRRLLRYLGVGPDAPALMLFTDCEPFFTDTAEAARCLRAVLARHGPAQATVHSTWLGRPERVGAPAEAWLDEVGGHQWWPKDVTWRYPDTDLRVLAETDADWTSLTVTAWGRHARPFLDAVATALTEIPKVPPGERGSC